MAAAAILKCGYLKIIDVTDVFKMKVAIYLLNLAMIGQIVKKWQPFFEIENGGDRHLDFCNWISNVIDKLKINGAIIALNLMMTGH